MDKAFDKQGAENDIKENDDSIIDMFNALTLENNSSNMDIAETSNDSGDNKISNDIQALYENLLIMQQRFLKKINEAKLNDHYKLVNMFGTKQFQLIITIDNEEPKDLLEISVEEKQVEETINPENAEEKVNLVDDEGVASVDGKDCKIVSETNGVNEIIQIELVEDDEPLAIKKIFSSDSLAGDVSDKDKNNAGFECIVAEIEESDKQITLKKSASDESVKNIQYYKDKVKVLKAEIAQQQASYLKEINLRDEHIDLEIAKNDIIKRDHRREISALKAQLKAANSKNTHLKGELHRTNNLLKVRIQLIRTLQSSDELLCRRLQIAERDLSVKQTTINDLNERLITKTQECDQMIQLLSDTYTEIERLKSIAKVYVEVYNSDHTRILELHERVQDMDGVISFLTNKVRESFLNGYRRQQ